MSKSTTCRFLVGLRLRLWRSWRRLHDHVLVDLVVAGRVVVGLVRFVVKFFLHVCVY